MVARIKFHHPLAAKTARRAIALESREPAPPIPPHCVAPAPEPGPIGLSASPADAERLVGAGSDGRGDGVGRRGRAAPQGRRTSGADREYRR
jgi:hypothetical protein